MGLSIPDVSGRVVEVAPVEVLEQAGLVTVRRRKFGPVRSAILRLLHLDPYFTIRFDRLGSAAWRLFDGRRTVADVRTRLEADFPEMEDVALRLGRFVGTLVSHGMVRLR